MALRFHLAGINNQNFLMRDEQTGTYWQQITGLAISGPLAGRRLTLVPADELTFALWKKEAPSGTVLNDVPKYASDYAPENWDQRMGRVPTVLGSPRADLKPRDLMFGVTAFGASRAYPFPALLKQKLVQDWIGSAPVLLVVGGDERSVRVFERRVPVPQNAGMPAVSSNPNFYRVLDQPGTNKDKNSGSAALLMDADTGSLWNFAGCAMSGKLQGTCLRQVYGLKDYWFDWSNYHPATSVYGMKAGIR